MLNVIFKFNVFVDLKSDEKENCLYEVVLKDILHNAKEKETRFIFDIQSEELKKRVVQKDIVMEKKITEFVLTEGQIEKLKKALIAEQEKSSKKILISARTLALRIEGIVNNDKYHIYSKLNMCDDGYSEDLGACCYGSEG